MNDLKTCFKEMEFFSINDLWIPLRPKTICIHGDHPNAAENLFSVLNSYKKNHLTS
jgi:lactam utilization protein B